MVHYIVNIRTANAENGYLSEIVDYCNLLNCIIDPLIYVVWLRETLFEILKMIQVIFPFFGKTIENMRIDIFNITTIMNRNDGNLRRVQKEISNKTTLNQDVQEEKMHKTQLNQDIQGGKAVNVPMIQVVQRENMHSAPINHAEQEGNTHSAPLSQGI